MFGWRSVGLAAQAVVPPAIIQKVQAERIVRVIVRLDVQTRSEGTLDTPQAVGAQRQAIASAQTFLHPGYISRGNLHQACPWSALDGAHTHHNVRLKAREGREDR